MCMLDFVEGKLCNNSRGNFVNLAGFSTIIPNKIIMIIIIRIFLRILFEIIGKIIVGEPDF